MFNKTVDSILRKLNKNINSLLELADRKDGEAATFQTISQEYSTLAKESIDESVRARKVANKLADLIS